MCCRVWAVCTTYVVVCALLRVLFADRGPLFLVAHLRGRTSNTVMGKALHVHLYLENDDFLRYYFSTQTSRHCRGRDASDIFFVESYTDRCVACVWPTGLCFSLFLQRVRPLYPNPSVFRSLLFVAASDGASGVGACGCLTVSRVLTMQEHGGPINDPDFSTMKFSFRAKDSYVMRKVLAQSEHQLSLSLSGDWNSSVDGPVVTLVFHERMPRIGLACVGGEERPLAALVAFFLESLLNLARELKVRCGLWVVNAVLRKWSGRFALCAVCCVLCAVCRTGMGMVWLDCACR
jgi:hypothetical protein